MGGLYLWMGEPGRLVANRIHLPADRAYVVAAINPNGHLPVRISAAASRVPFANDRGRIVLL